MSLLPRILRVSLAVVALVGCLTDETVTLRPGQAVVYGTVRSVSGSPVPDVWVAMRVDNTAACPATENTNVNVGTFDTYADAAGAFRVEVHYDLWPQDRTRDFCVHLVVTAPIHENLRDTALSVGPLRFTATVTDSVRADIVLQPR